MERSTGIVISDDKAKEIAINFLKQSYSVIDVKEAVLSDGIWIVKVLISSSSDQPRTILIDAKSGRIVDWHK